MKKLGLMLSVDPTFSADDWQLFEQPGREAAAARLNAALKEAVTLYKTSSDAYAHVYKVMGELKSFGARDSEPLQLLEEALGQVYGRQL